MSEWREYGLAEVYEFGSGLSKSADQFGFGYEFLSFKDVFYNYFLPKKIASLVNSSERERSVCSIRKGDVFLTRTSETQEELGMSSVALKDYPNATFNGFTKRLRPKGEIQVLPLYAGYYFRSKRFRDTVTSMASMTTRASLNNEMLSKLKITVPPLSEQTAIASVLSSLDDKIDLLHRQNETLEKMAETLFRQWFVEEAKEDWEMGDIYNLIDVIYGYPFQSKFFNEDKRGYPLVRIRDLKDGYSAIYTDESCEPKHFINNGDLIAGMDGEFKLFIWSGIKSVLNQRACKFIPKYEYVPYLYVLSLIRPHLHFYENTKVGTTVIHLGKADLDDIKISIPPLNLLIEFGKITDPWFSKLKNNNNEIRTLTSLRDNLLPKLMSGEVSLSNFGEVNF